MLETSIGAAARRALLLIAELSLLAVTATVVSLSDRLREDVEEAIASSVSELTQAETSAVAAGEPAWR